MNTYVSPCLVRSFYKLSEYSSRIMALLIILNLNYGVNWKTQRLNLLIILLNVLIIYHFILFLPGNTNALFSFFHLLLAKRNKYFVLPLGFLHQHEPAVTLVSEITSCQCQE